MPTLQSRTCGLSIRARGLTLQLIAAGKQVGFVVNAGKTDIVGDYIDGIPVMKLRGSKFDPRHWTMQALDRRDLARDLVAMLDVPHDLFVSSQPEVVTAYKSKNPNRPALFVCGGTTLLHDSMQRMEQNRHPVYKRPAFAIDRFLKQRNERAAFERADATVFDSESTRDLAVHAYGLCPERLHPIVGAVDDRVFQPANIQLKQHVRQRLGIGLNDFVVAWTGRLAPEKNLSALLRAVSYCARPPEAVMLIGDGPLREQLQTEAIDLGVAHRIRFYGDQPDVRPFLHAADAFVFPSRSESMGLSMLEAMACSLPVVAFKSDGETIRTGCEEVLDGGRCGSLVEPASAESLAGALDHLRANPSVCTNLGLEARRRVSERYNWPSVGRRFNEIVDALVNPTVGLNEFAVHDDSAFSGAMN
jgi:glycosyltransferase involved in cell wall biosynthesis